MKLSESGYINAGKRADIIIDKYDEISISHTDAIEGALLCVTEITIALRENFGRRMLIGVIDFWEGVKEIIENKLKEITQ